MGKLDLKKLRAAEEELKKRSGGDNTLFINRSMLDEPTEVRIVEPTPSMGGIYYLEVFSYWIDNIKVYSNENLGEDDIIGEILKEAADQRDPELDKLLKATKDGKGKRVRKDVEYWIPVLQLGFEEKNGEIISDIFTDGEYDPAKVEKYVVDGQIKILQAPITLLRDINKIASARGGLDMIDSDKGFNILVSRTKAAQSTKYNAVKVDAMPMPKKFYGVDNALDPELVVHSMMMDDEFQENVICNYLYGDKLLEKDGHYRFPDAREELSARMKEEKEEAPVRRERPGRKVESETQAEERPTRGRREAVKEESDEEPRSTRSRRSATTEEEESSDRPARGRGRNIADDYADE